MACQQAAVNSISALVAAFPEIKADVLGKIRRLLQSQSIPVKLNSLSVFVNIQGEGYHDELLLASKDSDPVIRQKAISLMGKFGEERFADQLVLSLADESTAVRLAAINAIVRLRPEKGLDPLISSLEDSDIWIRTAAAQALGEYRHPRALDPLRRHLQNDQAPLFTDGTGGFYDLVRHARVPGIVVHLPFVPTVAVGSATKLFVANGGDFQTIDLTTGALVAPALHEFAPIFGIYVDAAGKHLFTAENSGLIPRGPFFIRPVPGGARIERLFSVYVCAGPHFGSIRRRGSSAG